MAEKLKIIPLGGLNEIGKNMTAYEYGGEIIVVDCGMAFPGDDMYGIDCVIPDVSYLIKNKSRIRGLFITHGHEDHIGAIPYVLKQINMPIYCTRFTAGLIKLKLEEHQLVKSTKLITVEAGKSVRAGKFTVEFIHVNHSIADSVAFAIHTKMGTVVHTGDFKIDSTPIDGEVIDLARLGELGKEGVLCLCADSTNVERPGFQKRMRAVFAPWIIIELLSMGADTVALLGIAAHFCGSWFAPIIGRFLDRRGVRQGLLLESVSVAAVFLYAAWAVHGVTSGALSGYAAMAAAFLAYILIFMTDHFNAVHTMLMRSLSESPADVMENLSFGLSIDHILAVTVSGLLGAVWKLSGPQWVFVLGAAVCAVDLAVALWLKRTETAPAK